ncbi:MAG: EAL domain-containing protein [Ilumatobacter sp.]|uniref:putative bifunctional diguanylate cyclase/phosphodiesterase n=1 Tax=Ilumatobacter sp. TaxID=1967498 RepID=UPI0026364F5E|nr:EAL domain-containing protein [Ilumatobacter sp.]MDJ0767518.1 EAL domain-containing protein [Ilumatobacter sp.]
MNRSRVAPLGVALVGAALVVAYVLAPPSRAAEWLLAAAPALAALAVFTMIVVSKPVRPVPWALVAVGFVLMTAATAVGSAEWYGTEPWSFPGGFHAVGLLAYPALFVGVASITSDQRHSRDLLAGSEPIIYAIALTALIWLGITGPWIEDEGFPLEVAAWIWILPLLDGLLAFLAARRVSAGDGSSPVFEMMTLAFASLGAGHAAAGWVSYEGDFEPSSLAAAAPMVGPILFAVLVTLPSLRVVIVDTGGPVRVHWSQIFGLLVAALVPLGALILMLATGLSSTSSFLVVSLATVSVIVLALARMWRLVDQVRLLTEQRGHDRLAAMVEHSSDVVLLTDQDGRVSYASPGLRATLGYDPESWAGRHLVEIITPDERDSAGRQLARLVDFGHGGTVEFEATVVHADGQERKADVVVANLVGGSAVDGIVATFRDVTEQRNLERQLSHRAFHDELTGLANRALFLDRMDHALRVARPEADPVVVLFVDLDDFKSVNDVLGHGVGDQVLKTVADRIRRAAGSGDTAARLGGDEFAILLEDRGGIERAIDVAERLLDNLREPVSIAGYDVAVLASVGVAVATPGMSTTSLLRDADIAMYEAKRAGKGQIRIFDPAMRLVATKHLEYRGELGEALDKQQLRLVYMPFVDMRSGQVTGAEALIRWHHPEHGDVPAGEFVPIAERSGLIVPIGYWVLEQALAQAARWRPNLYLSVNISAVQIRQADFVDRVAAIVDRHHVDPSVVIFEITETVLVDEGDRATETVRRLREIGFRFAVDDFGAGYCSLSYLQRHPVDLLKIDRQSIEEFGRDPRGNTLARTILQTAESLDLLTVAEGIETTLQLRELRRYGCDLGQGYLLSHPLEAAELDRRFGQPDAALV